MELKTCPKCQTENPVAANFCRKCRYDFPEATKNGMSLKPKIKEFYIVEEKYVIGSTIHIKWDIVNYTYIEINGEDITGYNEVEFVVEKPSVITLVAFNDYDQTKTQISVKPKPLPQIIKFTSNSIKVRAGQNVKLSWQLKNFGSVFLNDGQNEIDVSGRFKYDVQPLEDTTYTLNCATDDPEIVVHRQLTVTVVSEVTITEFRSDTNFIIESEPVTLSWSVKNADKLFLYPNSIDVTDKSEIRLFPNRTTEYRLIATNSMSEKQEAVSVCVKPLPRVDINLDRAISSLQLPHFESTLGDIIPTVSETKIDKIILGQELEELTRIFSFRAISNKLKKMLQKRLL